MKNVPFLTIRLAISIPPLALSDALRVCSDILFHLGCAAAGAHPPKRTP